jgi:hypothetical protein
MISLEMSAKRNWKVVDSVGSESEYGAQFDYILGVGDGLLAALLS